MESENSARAEQDLWQRTLQQIPTILGRLVYLARLRDAESDRYVHHGLEAVFGAEAAEGALRKSHQEVLETLLSLPLGELRADVERYVDDLPQARRRTVNTWLKTKPHLLFLPPLCSDAQRELYEANLLLLLQRMKEEARGR